MMKALRPDELPQSLPDERTINVLLVEDNLPDIYFVDEMLPTTDYRLVIAKSIEEARDKCLLARFDIVLLDLSLPDSSGIQTFLSVSSFVPGVPIVILTGLSDDLIAAEAIKCGAQDFVQKNGLNETAIRRVIRYSIERNRTEGMLRESANRARAAEDYLKMALRGSHTGVWSWKIDSGLIDSDEQVSAMFGLTFPDQLDTLDTVMSIVHFGDRPKLAAALQTSVTTGQELDIEYRIVWRDGSEHYIVSSGTIVRDALGVPVSMAGISRDITRRKAEQKNAKRLIILEKHEDFIATLTHDLKNPLIGADRILELFLAGSIGELKAEQAKLLRLLRDSNSEMLLLIKNLLAAYSYDEGTTSLTYSDVDISVLAKACLRQLEAFAERSGVTFSVNFPAGNHTIRADSVALSRVLRNLISNAMKFTKNEGGIIVSGAIAENSYVLEVTDTGAGMSAKEVELLFRRYSQGAEGKLDSAGTGLGLYVCRQLVEAHGGTITCASKHGAGTTFTITLPLAQG